jgi:trehalose-6-phosphatase
MEIATIFSDYDGILCPTSSVKTREKNTIPEILSNILWDLPEKIPICIISSKDFDFIHNRTKFANIASCMLGVETLLLKRHVKWTTTTANSVPTSIIDCNNSDCIIDYHMQVENDILHYNSRISSSSKTQSKERFTRWILFRR